MRASQEFSVLQEWKGTDFSVLKAPPVRRRERKSLVLPLLILGAVLVAGLKYILGR